MLTSKPPFQSTTTDEIYRRAREREYEWPSHDTSVKFISQEAKDLVAVMLQEADKRPNPDDVVQHPFFASGYMPSEDEMSSRLREVPPDRQEFFMNRLEGSMQAISYRNLRRMCRECGVGPWSQEQVVHTQVWKEMAAEEKAGLTPAIPLAEGIVYRPFDEWSREQNELKAKQAASMLSYSNSPSEDPLGGSLKAPTGLLRQPPQSFAAQQRAQSRPATISGSSRSKTSAEPIPSASQSTRGRPRKELPRETAIKHLPAITSKVPRETTQPEARSTRSEPVNQAAGKTSVAPSSSTSSLRRQKPEVARPASLFSSSERPEPISDTQPDIILERLRRLQAELERALNSRTMAIISSKTATPPHPHVVVKWVDYTNKFGLGYILNDGSVGCILRDIPTTEGSSKTAMLPPAGIFIRGAERHIVRRQDGSYRDRNQPVPMTEPIKFFENNGESGLSEVLVSPEHFRVAVNGDGTAGKMNPGKDIYQHRKRERIILWKKFANYMIAYGRDEAVPVEETHAAEAMSPGQKGTVSELVTFYQRFGDVGCWVYCDGHLQVSYMGKYVVWFLMLTMHSSTSPITPRSSWTQLVPGATSGTFPRRLQRSSPARAR